MTRNCGTVVRLAELGTGDFKVPRKWFVKYSHCRCMAQCLLLKPVVHAAQRLRLNACKLFKILFRQLGAFRMACIMWHHNPTLLKIYEITSLKENKLQI